MEQSPEEQKKWLKLEDFIMNANNTFIGIAVLLHYCTGYNKNEAFKIVSNSLTILKIDPFGIELREYSPKEIYDLIKE